MPDADDWARRRREDALAQADRLARRHAAETERARELVRTFVEQAVARGLTVRPLLAKAGDGPPTYRTGLDGWYMTRDGMFGVTTGGDWYTLVHPVSLRARLRGVRLQPGDPPLQVGAGARDGESIALDSLVALRLDAGDDWPVRGL